MTRNITFNADETLIDDARAIARENNTTLNEQFQRWLELYTRKRRAERGVAVMERIASYAGTGGRTYTREERNERKR
jgi:hypothetical protein